MNAPVNFADFRCVAKRKLPRVVLDFVDSGAGNEVPARAKEAAFDLIKFRPRPLPMFPSAASVYACSIGKSPSTRLTFDRGADGKCFSMAVCGAAPTW